MDNGFY